MLAIFTPLNMIDLIITLNLISYFLIITPNLVQFLCYEVDKYVKSIYRLLCFRWPCKTSPNIIVIVYEVTTNYFRSICVKCHIIVLYITINITCFWQ